MSSDDIETEHVSVDVVRVTERALLVKNLHDEEVWIARPLIQNYDGETYEPGGCYELELPVWILKREGLV